jgi:DNA-binding GntR family transcriptional regulator
VTKAVDKAYSAIRSRILSGYYAPGAHLKEESVAVDTGVSRTPVREALRRLSTEHLVKFISKRGAYVANWSATDVDDIFRLRAMLEGYAAARAAGRITDAQIAELVECADRIEALATRRTPENIRRMLEWNQRFHRIIIDAAASERLGVMLSWLVEVPMLLRTYDRFGDAELARSNHHHREIITALLHRDPDWARNVMETHIRAAHRTYLSGEPNVAITPAAAEPASTAIN